MSVKDHLRSKSINIDESEPMQSEKIINSENLGNETAIVPDQKSKMENNQGEGDLTKSNQEWNVFIIHVKLLIMMRNNVY